MTEYELAELVREKVAALVARGVPPGRALRIVTQAVNDCRCSPTYVGCVWGNGLGAIEDEIRAASELQPVKVVREAVSGWLWLTSLLGFGMALINTRRISRMYSAWRARKGKR